MKRQKLSSQKIEHRGFDVSATKNFDLELKMVHEYNHPSHSQSKKVVKGKSNK